MHHFFPVGGSISYFSIFQDWLVVNMKLVKWPNLAFHIYLPFGNPAFKGAML